MSFWIRYTRGARDDLKRLFTPLAEREVAAAKRACKAISKSMGLLAGFPWSCRKAAKDNPFFRELVISFGGGSYVALFEIDDANNIMILVIRYQREEDFL
jgi:plasmid stabilization system protein ParE